MPETHDPAEVRAWARTRGIRVGKRGPLAAPILEQYRVEMGLSDEEFTRYDLADLHG